MAETITRSLYGGSVNIVFYPTSHRYKIEGEKAYLPSVTSITGIMDKPALIGWAVGCAVSHVRKEIDGFDTVDRETLHRILIDAQTAHEMVRDESASIGSQVHDFAHKFALSKSLGEEAPTLPDGVDEKVINGCSAFLDWVEQNNVEFLSVEEIAYSKTLGYVGIFDALIRINGEKILTDYKTSKGIYPKEQFAQVEAYRHAKNEEQKAVGLPDDIKKSAILHFNKETGEFSFRVITPDEAEQALEIFISLSIAKSAIKKLENLTK